MNKTLKIAVTGMLTALSIVTNLFTVTVSQNNAISFTITVCFVTGIYFGALPAAVVGFCGDLIAHFIHPLGAYNLFLALSTTVFGVIAALVYKLKLPKTVNLLIALAVSFVVCSCGLNTFGLWLQYIAGYSGDFVGLIQYLQADKTDISKSFWVYLGGRAPFALLNLAVNGVIVALLQQSWALDKAVARLKNKYAIAPTNNSADSAQHDDNAESTANSAEKQNDNDKNNLH